MLPTSFSRCSCISNDAWRVWVLSLAAICLSCVPLHATPTPTRTTLEISPRHDVQQGQPITLTATVEAKGQPISPGIVTFCDAAVPFCEDTAVLGTAAVTSNGTASMKKIFGSGSHSVFALFRETRANAGSRSEIRYIDVYGKSKTTTTLSKSSSSDGLSLQATVTGSGTTPLQNVVSLIEEVSRNTQIVAPLRHSTLSAKFAPPSFYPAAPIDPSFEISDSSDRGVVMGDFDGDGLPDLAVASNANAQDTYAGSVTFFLNDLNHPGQFHQGQTYALGSGVFALVIGDFNGDGMLDLVANTTIEQNGQYVSQDVLLLGNRTEPGQFTVTNIPSVVPFQVAADVNQDGVLDLIGPISGEGSAEGIDVLLGDPAHPGQFRGEITYPMEYTATVAVGDLNGDGVLDLVANSSYENSGVAVLLGDAANPGHFLAPVLYPTGSYSDPSQIVIGDFNKDGFPDIATTLYNGDVDVLLNNANRPGQFLAPAEYPFNVSPYAASSALTLGAFHSEDTLDLAVIDDLGVYVLPGDSAQPGQFLSPVNYPLPSGVLAFGLAAADFNGDGLSDLIVDMLSSEQFDTAPFTLAAFLTQVTQTATASWRHVPHDRGEPVYAYAQYHGDSDHYGSRSCTIDLSATGASAPTISDIHVADIGPTEAAVSWSGNGTVVTVNYGTTTALGGSTGEFREDPDRPRHTAVLKGLNPDTQYYYRLKAVSFSNDCNPLTTTSSIALFATAHGKD
jgi:hypothetical protein